MSYEPKMPLLLERDYLLFSPWDVLKSDKLADEGTVKFRKTSGFGLTFRIYGIIGRSDLTGEPTILDSVVMLGEEDVTNEIPERLMQEWVHEACEEAA